MSAEHKGLMDLTVIAKQNLGAIHRNLTTPRLVEEIVRNREGHLAHLGPVVVRTAHHADCAPADRYLITDETESPVNGLVPVSNSYNTTPNENRSLRPSTPRPRICSGAM